MLQGNLGHVFGVIKLQKEDVLSNFITFLVARLKEKSTITTIVTLITGAVGVNIAPDQKDLIVGAVVAVVSAIAAFWGTDQK